MKKLNHRTEQIGEKGKNYGGTFYVVSNIIIMVMASRLLRMLRRSPQLKKSIAKSHSVL